MRYGAASSRPEWAISTRRLGTWPHGRRAAGGRPSPQTFTEADMPGIFPVPAFKPIPPLDIRPQRRLRARTRLHRNRLDEELAAGADPLASEERILRAAQLRTHRERARIAKVLIKAIGSGHPEARVYSDSLDDLTG